MSYFFKFILISSILFIWNRHLVFAGEVTTTKASSIAPLPQANQTPVECRELQPGESQVVSETPGRSPSGVTRRYRLRRSSTNHNLYNVDVDFNFFLHNDRAQERYGNAGVPNDVHDHSTAFETQNDEQRAAFLNRARECFQSTSGQLTAPNGVRINLNLMSSGESEVPRSAVRIETSETRSTSSGWEGDINCPTIIHETMHLLGLVDGYVERAKKVSPQIQAKYPQTNPLVELSTFMYDCRRIEPQRSIMSNQNVALGNVYQMIVCPRVGMERGRRINRVPTKCPGGAPIINRFTNLSRRDFERKIADHGAENSYLYFEERPSGHPLTSEQMNFITKPSCPQSSSNYARCAQNAYRTRTLEGCLPTTGCN